MKINLLGKEIIFEIKQGKKNSEISENKTENKKFIIRFVISIIVFLIFGMLIEISNLKADYEIGTIAKNDVIAYKNVVYTVDLLDKNLETKIRKNTTPEYDRVKTVEDETINSIYVFFQESKLLNLNNDEEIKKFLQNNNVSLSLNEFKEIVAKADVKYILNIIERVKDIYSIGLLKKEDLISLLEKNNIALNPLDQKIIQSFINGNLLFNEKKTLKKIETNMAALKNKEIKINKGEIIVKKGEIIDEAIFEKLEKLNLVHSGDKIVKILGMLITFIMLSILFYYVLKRYSYKIIVSNVFYPTILTILIINLIYAFLLNSDYLLYLLPFGIIPIILTILGDKIYALTFTFLNMIIISRNDNWFLVTMAISVIVIYKAEKLSTRTNIVKLGIFMGIFQGIMAFSYGLINQFDFPLIIGMIVLSILSGILTGMLSLALLPYFENSFEILTSMKLVELSDFSNPLLKELLMKAPGTFHHSIMVGALAESAAEKIGANATFSRIASYYHDIGKMKRPEFFVENQSQKENIHDKMKPNLSALVITNHTKDGYIIGKQHKLPKEILNVILCHHGTTLVQFFYYKALETREEVNETDFRYSGPKPKTKEEGIILLADTIEAAVRSSKDKSKESIERLIRYLIKLKLDDGQLNESELTIGEIEIIIQAFLHTLQGFYHERIKYPKLDDENRRK